MLYLAKKLIQKGEDVLFIVATRNRNIRIIGNPSNASGDVLLTWHVKNELFSSMEDETGVDGVPLGKVDIKELRWEDVAPELRKQSKEKHVFVDEVAAVDNLYELILELDRSPEERTKYLWIALESSRKSVLMPRNVIMIKCFRNEHNINTYVQPMLNQPAPRDYCPVDTARPAVITIVREEHWQSRLIRRVERAFRLLAINAWHFGFGRGHGLEALVAATLHVAPRVSKALFIIIDHFQMTWSVRRALESKKEVTDTFTGGIICFSRTLFTSLWTNVVNGTKKTATGPVIVIADSEAVAGFETEAVIRFGYADGHGYHLADLARATTTLVEIVDEHTMRYGYASSEAVSRGGRAKVASIQEGYLCSADGNLLPMSSEEEDDLRKGRRSLRQICESR